MINKRYLLKELDKNGKANFIPLEHEINPISGNEKEVTFEVSGSRITLTKNDFTNFDTNSDEFIKCGYKSMADIKDFLYSNRPFIIIELKKRISVYNREADKKWNDKNKEKRAYFNKKSNCKSFILNLATDEDLIKVREWLSERESQK